MLPYVNGGRKELQTIIDRYVEEGLRVSLTTINAILEKLDEVEVPSNHSPGVHIDKDAFFVMLDRRFQNPGADFLSGLE